ncbi:MAG: tetratricopeptide repeat protein [Pirellulaceae bacterium]|nr:tetratricopeptide repeat protein [Pirellulaceae bacterium]
MIQFRLFCAHRRAAASVLLAAACWLLPAPIATAQNDQVFTTGATKSQRGTLGTVTKDGIQIKLGDNTKTIAAGEIDKILYTGDPSELTKGREFAVDGQYEQALEELEKIDVATVKRDVAKADVDYYIMMCKAKQALAGQGDKTEAVKLAMGFTRNHPNSWHFYSVAKLLGDLALAMNNPDQALRFYASLRAAPTTETKIESVYLSAITQLAKGDAATALGEFEKIIGLKAATPGALRLQTLAKAGKAVALARSEKAAEGLKLVNTLIADLNPTDVEMAARIYNAQGASYEASGDVEGAIMAYLHTHLMFSTQPDAHAEALSKLVTLWPKVGKPERAAEARQELQNRYPGFEAQ